MLTDAKITESAKRDVDNFIRNVLNTLSEEQRIRACGIIEGFALAERATKATNDKAAVVGENLAKELT